MSDDAETAPAKIEVRNLSFYYGQTRALHDVSLPLYERKISAFIGPSGCGKSTLLRTLNQIYALYPQQRAEGQILIDGEDILAAKGDINLTRARIGMVFQRPTPFPMSIFANVAFGVRLYEKLQGAALRERVESALQQAALWDELGGRLHASALGLSGGQQQRLCIARTIAMRPDVILFDEPTSALDPISTAKIEDLVLNLSKDYTIAIVTHNLAQAARISNYTAFMYLGKLVEFGETSAIFTRPKERRTEDYISGRFG